MPDRKLAHSEAEALCAAWAPVTKLRCQLVEKPWGRKQLPAMFGETGGRRVGEVWFDGPSDSPLLLKFIFTSERLSIQVHPDHQHARKRGLRSGKSECWYILDAEPHATVALGLTRRVERAELREAARDGSIAEMLNWTPVRAGDFLYVPAGMIHTIGAGISLLEVQQNADVTYRLYDYGRPRALQIDEAIAAAHTDPCAGVAKNVAEEHRSTLVDGPHFRIVLTSSDALENSMRWVIPLEGQARSGEHSAEPGECLLLWPGDQLDQAAPRMLIAGGC